MLNRLLNTLLLSLVNRRSRWRLGRAMYMSARKDVPNDMKTNGEERLLRELLFSHLQNPDKLVLFDVGANVGEWTRTALSGVHENSMDDRVQIHAFEPVASTFNILQENLSEIHATSDVFLVNMAMSDREGTTEIFVYGEGGGTNSLHADDLAAASKKRTIHLTSLDRYCRDNRIEHVHFVKCDTEGHDMSVLAGAAGLMGREAVYAVQFEYNHRWVYSRHYLKDAFDIVEGTNYRVGKVVPEGVELYRRWHPELERFFEGNYLIIHNSALDWFSTREGSFDDSNTYATA